MDADQLDAVARSLATAPSRRGMLAAGVSAALALLAGEGSVAGKGKKRRKKKCKPKCNACSKCKNGKCKSTCGAGSTCLVNGSCTVNCTQPGSCPPPLNSCTCGETAGGGNHCRVPFGACTGYSPCETTADCGPDQICQKCSDNAFHCATICQP